MQLHEYGYLQAGLVKPSQGLVTSEETQADVNFKNKICHNPNVTTNKKRQTEQIMVHSYRGILCSYKIMFKKFNKI